MYPSPDEYAAAVLRQLYTLYAQLGFSRRLLHARLLETLDTESSLIEREAANPSSFMLTPEALDIAFVRKVRMHASSEFQFQLFRKAWLVDAATYKCLVIAAIQRTNIQTPEEISVYEWVLLEALGTVYGLYDAEDYYRAIAAKKDAHELLKDGWRRGWIWSSEFGYPA